ncbi:MAG: UDP-2,3-diacylglucosamine diphosphatase LpxI, partial [Alphaproteobacteria bacterium]|nr:UDP-2,3-diacylglucosamine diphosphatase LpxI [Alphaproteobacteria bacterium]
FKKVLNLLKKHSISHISFIGSIKRPSLSSVKLDSESALFLTKYSLKKFTGGDNNLLSSILSFFENKGFNIIKPEGLSPELVTPKGVLGKVKPSKIDKSDIDIGLNALQTLGKLDIGQSIIVENSYVLGVEAAEGTSKLIKRCKDLKREKKNLGVLVKLKKCKQDSRIDLPSIGVDTIKDVKKAGLNGIAIGSNNSFIIDIKNVIKEADKNNIFLIGI